MFIKFIFLSGKLSRYACKESSGCLQTATQLCVLSPYMEKILLPAPPPSEAVQSRKVGEEGGRERSLPMDTTHRRPRWTPVSVSSFDIHRFISSLHTLKGRAGLFCFVLFLPFTVDKLNFTVSDSSVVTQLPNIRSNIPTQIFITHSL